jgi:hypothetical protein
VKEEQLFAVLVVDEDLRQVFGTTLQCLKVFGAIPQNPQALTERMA